MSRCLNQIRHPPDSHDNSHARMYTYALTSVFGHDRFPPMDALFDALHLGHSGGQRAMCVQAPCRYTVADLYDATSGRDRGPELGTGKAKHFGGLIFFQ